MVAVITIVAKLTSLQCRSTETGVTTLEMRLDLLFAEDNTQFRLFALNKDFDVEMVNNDGHFFIFQDSRQQEMQWKH